MERFNLNNKIIVVTGGCGLLGRQHVEAISDAGGIPIILDIDYIKVKEFVEYINLKYKINCSGFVVDITNEDSVRQNCEEIFQKFGKIDGLVNNAANNPKVENNIEKNFSRLENFKIDDWHTDLNVGLLGSFLCVKYYGFYISKNLNGGNIVNISSDLGLIAPDQRLYKINGIEESKQPVKPITYSIVKTGLIGLTRYVATYWAEKNVRCNAICPGGVENNQNIDFINEVVKRIPLNRLARKDEYQGILIFLLSDASSYITGAVIAADGGRTTW
jgi:NAD(P)-dependent dehydrogenase (short-subunit alcohol dehydrogenase family)